MLTRKRARDHNDIDEKSSGDSEETGDCESSESVGPSSSTETDDSNSDSDVQHSSDSDSDVQHSSDSDTDVQHFSGPSTSTRRGRREKAKEQYLKGKLCKPYHRSKDLERSLEDSVSPCGPSNPAIAVHFEASDWNDKVCKSCAPILMKYSETFKGMRQQGTELKRRKLVNPRPKHPEKTHY